MDEESDKNVKVEHFERFNIKFHEYLVNEKDRSITMTPSEYNVLIDETVAAKNQMKHGQLLTSRDIRRIKVYNTVL
jgi:hypothetical protein